MEDIQELQKKYSESRAETLKIKKKINELTFKEELPKIRKKYEGKFWKYRNSYGCDETWFMYSTCIEVVSQREGIFKTFQTMPDGYKFGLRSNEYFNSICEIEITSEEYFEALEEFKKSVNSI